MSAKFVICVDFDGTIVEHDFPDIKTPIPGAIETLQDIVKKGSRLVLYTMRHGETLDAAVQYLKDNGVELYGINENPGQKSWSKSPKVYGHIYIDDAALSCPLQYGLPGTRPFVDWTIVRKLLQDRGAI